MASSIRDTLGFLLPAMSSMELASRTSALSQTKDATKHWTNKHIPLEVDCSVTSSSGGSTGKCPTYHPSLFDNDLKGLVRQGIPAELRPKLWFWLSGGYALQYSSAPGLYAKLRSSTEFCDDSSVMSIEEGVDTLWYSFRFNTLLQSRKGSEALARIMYATVQHSADIRYSRGLHQMAAFVLVVLGIQNEEAAFWTLLGMVKNKLFPYARGEVRLGVFVEQGVLEHLVHKKMPRVSSHMTEMGWDLADITKGWFNTLFTSHLPPETSVRVWDAILSEGSKVMHRVALAIIKRHEPVILGCTQLPVMLKVLDLRLKRTTDEDALMQLAFRGIGSMPSAQLSQFRQQVLNGSAYAQFSVTQAAGTTLRLEREFDVHPVSAATQNSTGGLKGWLGRGFSRVSTSGSHSCAASHASLGASSTSVAPSQACSDSGYGSDALESVKEGPPHKRRTASGRSSVQFK